MTATDPDGDALNYSWETTAGSLNQTDGASVVWLAPATGSGTAQTTVIVTDANGGQTSRTAYTVYNDPAQQGNRLSFVIKDNLDSDQPVQGMTIALYNTDNRTIAQTKISDANGVVDFGDIGRSRATITFVYDDAEGDIEGDRYIDTFVDVLVAQNIIYYQDIDTSGDGLGGSGSIIANVDLTLSDIPADASAGFTRVQPLGALQLHGEGSGGSPLNNLPVSETHLQNDGKLSMLALTTPDVSNSNLIAYGYLLDQTVTEGTSYDISLARSPVNLGWATSPETPMWLLSITGLRSGQEYDLMPFSGVFTDQSTSGTVVIPSEFPVDNYEVIAVGGNELATTGWISLMRYNTLPQSLVVPVSDYIMDSFSYTEATRTFSWGITGSLSRDFVALSLINADNSGEFTWTVMMDENTSSWQVMDLPAPASGWIEAANITSHGMEVGVSVQVCDWDIVDGMDQLWESLTSGGSTLEMAQSMSCGSHGLAELVGINSNSTIARKEKAGKPLQNSSASGRPDLPGKSLGRLHRR